MRLYQRSAGRRPDPPPPRTNDRTVVLIGTLCWAGLAVLGLLLRGRLEAQGRGSGDPMIELRDEAGSVVASDDDSGGNGAARAETQLQPGRYCLTMKSYDGAPMSGFVRVGRSEHEPLTTGLEVPV